MEDTDGGIGSTAACGDGVDSGPPGSLSTAADGPFRVQSIQDVMNQLFRMERKIDAVLEEQRHYAASSGSTAGPPEAESGHKIPESWPFQRTSSIAGPPEAESGHRIPESCPFQRNVRRKHEPQTEVTIGQKNLSH